MGWIHKHIYTTLNPPPPSQTQRDVWSSIRHIEFEKIEAMLFLCLSFSEKICQLKFRRYIFESNGRLLAMKSDEW
jgi:hypothetical protein